MGHRSPCMHKRASYCKRQASYVTWLVALIDINKTRGIKKSRAAGLSKKPKTYHFHAEWEEDFFFTMSFLKCICLICRTTITVQKKGNVERHFWTVHKKYDTDFPQRSELRRRKVRELKSQIIRQQSFFKHKKSFQDKEMIKEAFVEAADSLFQDFNKKPEILSSIKALQLSRSTVTQRCEVMVEDLTQQLQRDIADCECFSLQLDVPTDTGYTLLEIRVLKGFFYKGWGFAWNHLLLKNPFPKKGFFKGSWKR